MLSKLFDIFSLLQTHKQNIVWKQSKFSSSFWLILKVLENKVFFDHAPYRVKQINI